jgi:glutathione S-transferase
MLGDNMWASWRPSNGSERNGMVGELGAGFFWRQAVGERDVSKPPSPYPRKSHGRHEKSSVLGCRPRDGDPIPWEGTCMYKLYNVKGWGSMSVHLLLEELGVPYENIWMVPAQVRTPEFRQRSPLGFVPALGLADGRTLFETAAILTFLVTTHAERGLSPPPGSDDFGEFLSWLELLNSNLYKAIGMAFHGDVYAMTPEHNKHIFDKAVEQCDALWAVIDQRLAAKGPWLMGNAYSAADIYAFTAVTWGRPNEMAVLGKFAHVAKLAEAIRARPKLKAVLEAHDVTRPASDAA